MDNNTSYAWKIIVKCLLFLERQLRKGRHKSRRHKSSMANQQDDTTHQTATKPALEALSSGNESSLTGVKASSMAIEKGGNDRGEMCAENKIANGPAEGGRPKKSLFEITNVENSENRGDSVGNEVDDSELDDTLSESQEALSPTELKRLSSPIAQESLGEIKDKNSNGSEVSQTHSSTVGLTSRFKIVKIARVEPYKRGRWACQEFMDSSSEGKLERNPSEPKTPGPNNNAPTNYVPESRDRIIQNLPTNRQERVQQPNESNLKSVDSSSNGADSKHSNEGSPETMQGGKNGQGTVATGPNLLAAEVETKPDEVRQSGEGSDARRLASAQATPLSIQDALSQITTIQSTLEGVVQTLRDVETLKETVTTWTDENLRLKEENELLKKKLQQQEKGNERKESS